MVANRDASFMTVVRDIVTQEEVDRILEHLKANEEEDHRPGYGFNGQFPGSEDRFEGREFEWDPTGAIKRVANYVYNFYVERYGFEDTFFLDRVHGNYMHEGAKLEHHKDHSYSQDPNSDDPHDTSKKTYVCSFMLNDDYEGGKFVFEDQGRALKPKPGDLVIFAGHCTSHEVEEITKGTRINILFMFYEQT